MAITFRNIKGTSLTHTELDNNFREFYYSASYDGSGLYLYKSQSLNNVTNLPFQAPSGKDYFIQVKSGNFETGSNAIFTASANFKYDFNEDHFKLTGSFTQIGDSNISGNLIVGGTVTAEEFITEKVATSYIYKSGSTKFGDDVEDNHAFTGSVDVTGKLNVRGNSTLTGSLAVSGSKIEITGSSIEMLVKWPEAPGEYHLLQTDPFTLNIGSKNRTYQYAALALDHYETGFGALHNSFNLYIHDSTAKNYGSEFLLGPITGRIRMKASGSGKLGGMDISEINGDGILAELYGSNVEVGVFRGENIRIGNINSVTNISGSVTSSALYTEGTVHSKGSNSKVRFNYATTASLPSATSYKGMFAQVDDVQKSYFAQNNEWVELATSASIAETYLKNTTDTLTGNLTITDTVTTNNLTVLGTGSFGYIQAITGSAKIIGDAYIYLNNNTPTEPYAGIKVLDSGSAGETGSFEYDSNNNHWFYESSTEGYAAAFISGPTGSRGALTFPTVNTLTKGLGGNHIGDSIITDNGSTATVTGDLIVTGIINGTLTGSIENAVTASYIQASDIAGTVDISSQTNLTAGTNITIVGDTINSSYIDTTYSAGTGVNLVGTTFSIGQSVGTGDTVTFSEVRATGDIIAYQSSDENLKDNILTITNAVEKVQQIRGVSFDWNSNQSTHEGHDIGVIAQDIEKILPEIVLTRDNGYKAVRYEKIVALLIEAVKEQQSQIEELKAKL